MEDQNKKKQVDGAVAILCAKWWRKWQDYTNQSEDEVVHLMLD